MVMAVEIIQYRYHWRCGNPHLQIRVIKGPVPINKLWKCREGEKSQRGRRIPSLFNLGDTNVERILIVIDMGCVLE